MSPRQVGADFFFNELLTHDTSAYPVWPDRTGLALMPAKSKDVRRSLEQELVSRGLRMTHQRRLLIQIIQSAESHLDAIALWERARAQDPTLNKVTVYRTLAMLKKLGLVDELDLMHLQGGKHYYEAKASRDHIHLACLKCGRIQEFESSLFEKLKGQIERQRRFRIGVVRVEAGGICDKCREQ
jgi:Fur family ferric uptake transcriptional regulator